MSIAWKINVLRNKFLSGVVAVVTRLRHGRKGEADTLIVLTGFQVKKPRRDAFLQLLRQYTLAAGEATGHLLARAYYEDDDACTMWLFERWQNRDGYLTHKRRTVGKAMDRFKKEALESPARCIFLEDLGLLERPEPAGPLGRVDASVTILLFIEVKAGTGDQFKSLNRDLLLALRDEPGVLFFQFGQECRNPSSFVVCKKFRDWQSFQHHFREPAFQPVLKFLQTSIKEPPFEKKYHYLIPITLPGA